MMVMPLGPDFARALGISTAHLGLIAGSYTAAAAVAGIARRALPRSLRSAQGAGRGDARAWSSAPRRARSRRVCTSLVIARAIAGAFGGPGDLDRRCRSSPTSCRPARRGRAMGAVMGAFSVASVLGVPLRLELASVGGWRLPFFVVAALGVVVVVLALLRDAADARPHRRAARRASRPGRSCRRCSRDGTIRLALAMNGAGDADGVPGHPEHRRPPAAEPRLPARRGSISRYMVGGAASFLIMRVAGRAIDRYGAARVAAVGTAVLIGVLYFALHRAGRDRRRRRAGRVRPVHGRHVDPQRQHELAVDAGAARRSARRLHVAAVDRAAHLVGDRRVRVVTAAARRPRAAGSRASRRSRCSRRCWRSTLPPMLAAIGRRVSAREASSG